MAVTKRTQVSARQSSQPQFSLVDSSWETLDPNPDIYSLFSTFNDLFFDGKLSCCEVKWSTRMTLCAGLCSYEGRHGLCSIRLSQPLLKFRPRKDLVETLLHEMIHAYLFVAEKDRDREAHGPNFQQHMRRINKAAGTSITIYHSFHAEVASYQQHWWRCNGICRSRKPFYGWVKRASNRAPSKNDYWWEEHQNTCGGTFVKVKEPEGYVDKRRKREATEAGSDGLPKKQQPTLDVYYPDVMSSPEKNKDQRHSKTATSTNNFYYSQQTNIDTYFERRIHVLKEPSYWRQPKNEVAEERNLFSGRGYVLGHGSSGGSAEASSSSGFRANFKESTGRKSLALKKLAKVGGVNEKLSSEIVTIVSCPSCGDLIPESDINTHLDSCLQ